MTSDATTLKDLNHTPAWPRLRDIPEPRMVCLHVGHGSGSKVFQSYLDGHPQIYMIPAYPLLYLYPHWRRWETELGEWTWSAIIDAFCIQHASVIDPHTIPGHNGMTGLGDSRNETTAIDDGLFRNYLLHCLDGEPVSIRTFILALHYAYAFCRGEDSSEKRVLVYHIHVQAYVSKYLLPDFPDMQIVGMVRDQRANHHGRYAHSISGVQDQKLNRSDAIVFRRRNYYEVYCLLYRADAPVTGADPEKCRVVRVEDLHLRLEDTMRAVAGFIGVDFHPCLLKSTFGGLTFWGDPVYEMAPMNKTNPRMVSKDWQTRISPMDWFVLEGLFFDYLNAYGYPVYKYKAHTLVNRIKLFLLMLLPSKTERREFLNYLKPSTVSDYIAACDAEARGDRPLIDYSFNAYYRHRWGAEDMPLWKPRWYRKLAAVKAGDTAKVNQLGRLAYVCVGLARYLWAVVDQPLWVIRRWPMSVYAFSRSIGGTFDLPGTLPKDIPPRAERGYQEDSFK